MGLQSVTLLRALRDKPGATVEDLSLRLGHDRTLVAEALHELPSLVTFSSDGWKLRRPARRLLEHLEAENPRERAIDFMMRQNAGLVGA